MTAFWSTLELFHGGSLFPTILIQRLGPSYPVFKTLFLIERPDQAADAVPCPWNCGCHHKLVPQSNGTVHGICQCDPPHCGTYTVLPHEPHPQYLDWSKLAKAICKPLGLDHKNAQLGLFSTMQIGAWRNHPDEDGTADAIPVILTLPAGSPELLNTIAVLVAKVAQPFILLVPVASHFSPAAKELLESLGAKLFALDAILALHPDPPAVNSTRLPNLAPDPASLSALVPKTRPENLFAGIAPLFAAPSEEALARRTFLALQDAETNSRARKPTLYTVFKHYCIEELTARQTARKCRCSLGTISKRLIELRRKTGVTAVRLRRISSYFSRLENDFAQANSNYQRRKYLHD